MTKETSEELVKVVKGALVAPSFINKDDTSGTEHIEQQDLQMPRLGLAQKMSPQIEESKGEYIEGLKFGQFFNSLTQENYEKGPLDFLVIRADRPRGIEFYPMDDGGGVKDMNVSRDDPRMQFGPDGEKPTATLFYDYIIALIPTNELIALSLKGSGLKAARQLNGLMKIRSGPCFAGLYEVSTVVKSNDKGTYAVYQIRNSPRHDGWAPNEETYNWAQGVFENIADRKVTVDLEEAPLVNASGGNVPKEEDDDNVPF